MRANADGEDILVTRRILSLRRDPLGGENHRARSVQWAPRRRPAPEPARARPGSPARWRRSIRGIVDGERFEHARHALV